MKANELMIGDWVQFDNGIKSRVNCISPHQRYVAHTDNATWIRSYDELYPIPLTKDILLNNGFHDGGYKIYYLDLGDDEYPFRIQESKKGLIDAVCYKLTEFKYVHQLQHALRLCGLGDVADNLKV